MERKATGMRIALALALAIAMAPLAAQAERGRHDGPRRFERPPPAGEHQFRDARRGRDEADERDLRRRERLSDEERRRLREDVDAATREIYRRRR